MDAFEGMNVVVTGKIAGESRPTAEARLRAAGAHVQSSVTGTTDLLICGVDVGQSKLRAAEKHGVQVITWDDAIARIEGRSPTSHVETPSRARDAQATPQTFQPNEVAPMLCKKALQLPGDDGWLFEIKWDGFRCVAHVDGAGGVVLRSRQGNDLTDRFAQVAADLARLPHPCVLDGELVALDELGRSDFQGLGDGAARFMAFDLLELDNGDVRSRPLKERRGLLEALFSLEESALRGVSPAFTDGGQLLVFAIEQQLEGVVAKRADSTYRDGARSPVWLKVKVRQEQEFVIVGYTEGNGVRASSAGAFLLAVNDEETGRFAYCGSVGTGGKEDEWIELVGRLTEDVTTEFAVDHDLTKADQGRTTWVAPDTVVQVRFQHWTRDGKLWHPSLQGVREDKTPAEVVRELSA